MQLEKITHISDGIQKCGVQLFSLTTLVLIVLEDVSIELIGRNTRT